MSSNDKTKDVIKMSGTVTGINRGGIFNVEVPFGTEKRTVLARCNGKMRQFQIKIVVGDTVEMEFSPYDLNLGRIARRAK